ncbi:MAG TPA: hypothetical protein VGQ39_14595 [Pyrinomonadaceae bacterium]|nr:hypothetical protein [Pyrinomonadaceae bacterium]
MNQTLNNSRLRYIVGIFVLICAASIAALAQTPYTPGGTTISNTATSSYSDGTTSYATTSNTVSVTVSNIAGLAITPDAGTRANVVLSQTGVDFNFTVTNTGNFTNQVVFKALGASIIKTGSATVTAAVIDVNKDGLIDGGDTDILANAADVTSANVLQDGTLFVIVRVTVDAGAATGSSINIQLGDAVGGTPWDNKVLAASAADVRTATAGTNGQEEARGDITATVENDALIRLQLTRTAGPVAIGSDITYQWVLTNDGARAASAQTLTVDGSPVTGIFILAPIPARTVLKSGQSFPAGTIYTTTAITTAPLAATWSATAPADLNTLTRIGFNTGNSLAAAASTSTITMLVTVKSGISIVLPIRELGDAFSKNSLPTPVAITDQSHDAVANAGDGNADFTQGDAIGSVDGDGVMLNTTLSGTGGVLLGPSGFQGAVGPTDTNDDYTNRSVNTGIATVAPGGNTTAQGIVTFTNTVANTGNADDTYTFTAPTVPSGFTVEVSVNGLGTDYVNVNTSPSLAVAYGSSANILVKVTEPSGNVVLTAYPTVIRATSLNTSSATNDTIDRLYTGYLQLTKSQVVANATSRGGATDPVPGATIAYTVAYDNVTTSGGTNNSTISASSIVLIDPVPANTDFKVASATSNPAAGITLVVTAYSNDGGSTWTYTPVDGAGGAPAGYDRTVTHVRFTLTGPMAPADAAGNNGFTVRIR